MIKKYKKYDKEGLDFLGQMQRPVPGQSLTNSPDNPYPWEQPPRFTEIQPAIESLFLDLTEPEAYEAIVDLVDNNNTIADIAQILLHAGFQEGLWNPDLMALLIEPTMYLVMALVERAGRLEYEIIREDETEMDSPDQEDISQLESILTKAKVQAQEKKVSGMKSGVLPTEIEKQIKEVEVPESLLQKQTEE
jgi:hypothetical protein